MNWPAGTGGGGGVLREHLSLLSFSVLTVAKREKNNEEWKTKSRLNFHAAAFLGTAYCVDLPLNSQGLPASLLCLATMGKGRGQRGSSATLPVKAEVEAYYYFMAAEEARAHSEASVALRRAAPSAQGVLKRCAECSRIVPFRAIVAAPSGPRACCCCARRL